MCRGSETSLMVRTQQTCCLRSLFTGRFSTHSFAHWVVYNAISVRNIVIVGSFAASVALWTSIRSFLFLHLSLNSSTCSLYSSVKFSYIDQSFTPPIQVSIWARNAVPLLIDRRLYSQVRSRTIGSTVESRPPHHAQWPLAVCAARSAPPP